MNVRNLIMGLALVAFSVSSTFAQNDFFFSFADVGEGVVNGDATADLMAGDTAELFIYWSPSGSLGSDLASGFFANIMTSAPGVIEFTAAETFDYDLLFNGASTGLRWDSFDDPKTKENEASGFTGAAVSVEADMITDLRAFTVQGSGVTSENNGTVPPFMLLDAGYDADADAFQLGSIQFTALGTPGPGGFASVDISAILTQAQNGGTNLVDDNGNFTGQVGGATINVGVIPEPTSAGLLALGLVGLVARRRR